MQKSVKKMLTVINSSAIINIMKNKYIVILLDNLTGTEKAVIRTKTQVKAMKHYMTFTIQAVYKVGEKVCKY